MKNCTWVLAALFTLTGLPLQARSTVPAHITTWVSGSGQDRIVLTLRADNTYRWNTTEGRYAIQRGQIWFLEKNRTGIKWHLTVTPDTLTLYRPEDFRYLGKKGYFYFQMTSPVLRHTFKVLKK